MSNWNQTMAIITYVKEPSGNAVSPVQTIEKHSSGIPILDLDVVKVRLIVSTNPVIDNLQIFRKVHVETGNLVDATSNLWKQKQKRKKKSFVNYYVYLYLIELIELNLFDWRTRAMCSCSSVFNQADFDMRYLAGSRMPFSLFCTVARINWKN